MLGALQKILDNTSEEGTITEVEEYVVNHNLYRVHSTKPTIFYFQIDQRVKGSKFKYGIKKVIENLVNLTKKKRKDKM